MNILLDIAHPSQAHFFHAFLDIAKSRGHSVTILGREKDCTNRLLRAWGMPPQNSTIARQGVLGNFREMLMRDLTLWRLARNSRADVILGTPPSVAHAGWLLRTPRFIVNEDDVDVVPQLAWTAYPFATGVIAPECVRFGRWKRRHVPYRGCQKLAYLHPNIFTADPQIPRELGLGTDLPYAVVRLTAFSAYHDRNQRGLDPTQLARLIGGLSRRYRVCITTESELPPEFADLRLDLPEESIHHVLAGAALFAGDSQSMTTESALLGVPAFRCNTFAGKSSVMTQLENDYELLRSFTPDRFDDMMRAIDNLPPPEEAKKRWRERRDRYVADSVDVTAWLLDFVERTIRPSFAL